MGKNRKPTVANPNDSVLWCKEAVACHERGDDKAAIYCYKESLKVQPKNADVWYNILTLSEKTGDRASALAAACTAEKVFPSDYRFPAEAARFFAEGGKIDEAIAGSERAIAINPHSPTLLSNKAGYLLAAGRNEEALDVAERALAIDPAYISAVLHKSHALVNLGRLDDAELNLDAVQGDIRALKMQINICIRNQKLEKAMNLSENAAQISPLDDEIWGLKGIVLAYRGDKEAAAKSFAEAIRLNPHEKSYRTNLAALRKQ